MDQLVAQCVGLVQNNGGSLTYPQILAAIPFESRSALPKALKQARSQNLLSQTVQLIDGAVVHTYHVV